MRDRADRWDYLLAGALSLLTVLSRLPYRARMLYNWDAVQFALALREYDVVKHQPHPPGYILYVGLGVRAAGGGLQRPHHVRRVPARARDLRPRDGAGGSQRARRQPALLVLRIGRAHLRRRGAVRLDRGVLRVSCAGGQRGRRVARRRVSGAGGGHATVAAAVAAADVARRLRARRAPRPDGADRRGDSRRAHAALVRADGHADGRAGTL